MSKKKDAIRDYCGAIVLVETIAAFKIHSSTSINLILRNGITTSLNWNSNPDRNKAIDCITSHLNILNEGE